MKFFRQGPSAMKHMIWHLYGVIFTAMTAGWFSQGQIFAASLGTLLTLGLAAIAKPIF